MHWAYFFAITSEKLSTMRSIWIDFINMWIITIYFLIYRNPVFGRKVKNILWFPYFPKEEYKDDPFNLPLSLLVI
jgi:hypothetical protein